MADLRDNIAARELGLGPPADSAGTAGPAKLLLDPLPDLPEYQPGSETEFSDLVADRVTELDAEDSGAEDIQQRMIEGFDEHYSIITSLSDEIQGISDAAGAFGDLSTDDLEAAFNDFAPALDVVTEAFTDFNTAPAPPPFVPSVTDEDIQAVIDAGDALGNLPDSTPPSEQGGAGAAGGGGVEATPPPPPAGDIAIQPDKSILWTTQNALAARVYVSVDDSPWALFAEGQQGQQPVPWLVDGHKYIFKLVDFSAGADGAELRRAVLDVTPGSAHTAPQNSLPPAAPTPPAAVAPAARVEKTQLALATTGARPGPAQPPAKPSVSAAVKAAAGTIKAVVTNPTAAPGLAGADLAAVAAGTAAGQALQTEARMNNAAIARSVQAALDRGDVQSAQFQLGRPITAAELEAGAVDASNRDATGQALLQHQLAVQARIAAAPTGVTLDEDGFPIAP